MITSVSLLLAPSATVIAAPYAPAGQVISGTSTTALAIPLGPPPIPLYVWSIVETNIGFRLGMRIRAAASDATAGTTTWIEGIVTAWDEVNLTIQPDLWSGLGTHNAWNVNVTGQPGLTGPQGAPGAPGQIGPAWGTAGTGTSIDSPVFTGVPTSTFTPGQGTTHANDATLATTQFVTTSVAFSLNNTSLLGNPTAPTPAIGDNDTSIATTAFVARDFAPLNNPVFIGDPKAPTPLAGDNDKSIATTEFVATSFAPINAPLFTGDARAVTPVPGDNDTSIATTAFVTGAVALKAPLASPAFSGTPSAVTPGLGSNDTSLATTAFVHTAIVPLATLISPAFTGTPSAPTPGVLSADGSLATTQFVKTAIQPLAKLDSPYFIGLPTAPTQGAGTSDGTLATTQFCYNYFQPLNADLSALSGVTGAGVMYYRSSAGAWSPVEMGANMTFTGGTLSSAGGGGGTGTIAEAPSDGTYYARRNATWAANAIQVDAPSDTFPYVRLNATWSRATAAGLAPLASPAFTGTPTAPTVTPSTDNTTKLATTAFVQSTLGVYAPINNPVFTGTPGPQAPTPDALSNDGTIATTAFVKTATAPLAPTANPVFTGDPKAPTATAGDNDTSIATTAFVTTAISGKADTSAVTAALALYAPLAAPTFTGDAKAVTPATGDNDTSIATTQFVARDFAPISNPTFTTAAHAPTPATAANDTSIATAAFVKNQGYLSPTATATISAGYTFAPFNAGTKSSGTFTPDPTVGSYQFYINGGAHTVAAPTADCAIDIMITNSATAGAITFSGFTVGAVTGDALTTTSANIFVLSIRRINGISTYAIKALQ